LLAEKAKEEQLARELSDWCDTKQGCFVGVWVGTRSKLQVERYERRRTDREIVPMFRTEICTWRMTGKSYDLRRSFTKKKGGASF